MSTTTTSISLSELLYSASSFHAISWPVSVAMTLAALAAVFVNNDESLTEGEQQLAAAYTVWKLDPSQRAGTQLLLSLGNTLVMCVTIAVMTFGIVILYKFRCMTLLTSYMIFSSASLLGFLGGSMFQVAAQIYYIPVDTLTFLLLIYNFATVGILAIFYPHGVPTYITQAYLVATAVILAWNLAHFDAWTAWTLLVMLALYDLCAVLTPCGPLKFLVQLMQQKDSPDMPGLLYEAKVQATSLHQDATTNIITNNHTHSHKNNNSNNNSVPIPLAIARLYQLTPSIDSFYTYPNATVHTTTQQHSPYTTLIQEENTYHKHVPLLQDSFYQQEFTTQELTSIIHVELPPDRGKIETIWNIQRTRAHYEIYDAQGNLKRILGVNRKGQVYELKRRNIEDDGDSEEEEEEELTSSSIRLGLGDFIFYSVLVAKAAMYSFTAFAACTLVILTGLGGTLLLLSIYHSALPALPISIFLGVFFYLVTRALIQPYIQTVLVDSFYV